MDYFEVKQAARLYGPRMAAKMAYSRGTPFKLAFHAILGKLPRISIDDAWDEVLTAKGR